MRKVLHCTACNALLSVPLEILSGKDPGVAEPAFEDGKPLTPAGVGFKSYEPILSTVTGARSPLDFTPQYWLNPDDLTSNVRRSSDRRRLNGCCGFAGTDGPNQTCRCGAEIGTLQTDCWTPRVFIPQSAATTWIDEP